MYCFDCINELNIIIDKNCVHADVLKQKTFVTTKMFIILTKSTKISQPIK